MNEILPGLYHWATRHPRIGIEVSSHWLEEGGVAIDPLLPPEGLDWFRGRARRPAAILLSNRHHYRQSGEIATAFDCPVLASRPGMHEFESTDADVTAFDFGDELPGGVVAVEIGGICPDDTALYFPAQRALLFADALVSGRPHGTDVELGFVDDRLMDDPPQTKAALLASFRRVLDELDFDHILRAHGAPLIGSGRRELQAFVEAGGWTAF